MSKKTILLALAAAGVAMFALPVGASAQEIHLEAVTSFSGTAGASTLTTESEPVITCESADVEGTVSAGGTTGNTSLDFTGCHTTVFGITAKCRTSGSPIDNTIKSSGVFHLITISSLEPGILVTPVVTTIVCAGISNTVTGGNLIGELLSPTCFTTETSEIFMNFAATGSVQRIKTYTGATYNLTTKTGSEGTVKQAGLSSSVFVKSTTKGRLNCT
jgi:hypothetical protein